MIKVKRPYSSWFFRTMLFLFLSLNAVSCIDTNCKKYVAEFYPGTYFASLQEGDSLSFEKFTEEDKNNCFCPKNGPLCDGNIEDCYHCPGVPAKFETYIFFFKNKSGEAIKPDVISLHFFDSNCREQFINLKKGESLELAPQPRAGPFEFKALWKEKVMHGKTILYYDKFSGSEHVRYCKMIAQGIEVIFPVE